MTLEQDCDYVDSWSLHVAAYKPTSAVQTLSFGPFDLGLARHWTLLGSTQPGRRFAAAILPVEHLPPSYHSRWHHCYWSVCVDAVALDGNSSKTLVVPILFFPSSVFSLPYAPSVDSSLARHETKIKLTGYGCCVPAGFIRSTLAWPAPPSLASVLQDDRSTFITGVAIPLTLTLDLAHVNPSFIAPDEVKPGRIAVHQRIMGTTSCIDDVLSLDKIDVVWVDESEDAEVKKWTSTVVLPDKLITSFETPAFLLAVKVRPLLP